MTFPVPTQVAARLRQARRVMVFTGAGVSAESGVPTFRDSMTGLWAQYDPQRLATAEAFHADPELVWGWYEWRRALVSRVQPNDAHRAVAEIEARLPHTVVVTQNVDDLHERAGSGAPVHLHGSLFAPRCVKCAAPAVLAEVDGDVPASGGRITPPSCVECGGLVRPGVVWFGETLPHDRLQAAIDSASTCDLLLTIGTSAVVYPAAEVPRVAARNGAAVIQVNPAATALDSLATANLRGAAGQVLPALVAAAWP